MAANVFRHAYRVTYADCTVGNHVYYGRYLELLELARGEFLRHLGASFLSLQETDTLFPVIECRLRYLAPARYDDILTLEAWPTLAEKVRVNFAYRILKGADVRILEAETRHVCTGLNERPKRLPEALRARLVSCLIPPP